MVVTDAVYIRTTVSQTLYIFGTQLQNGSPLRRTLGTGDDREKWEKEMLGLLGPCLCYYRPLYYIALTLVILL